MREVLSTAPADQRHTLPGRLTHFLASAAAGRSREAAAELNNEIEALALATDLFPRFLAQGFALAGDRDSALRWLQVAIDRGFVNYPFLACHDPSFEVLRGDAAFVALIETARRRWLAFEA